MAERRMISKQRVAWLGHTIGQIRAYSDGSAELKLKKDDEFVQATFSTIVSQHIPEGFVQDPENPHIFIYQLPSDEEDAGATNEETA